MERADQCEYRIFQTVECRIVKKAPGGYDVQTEPEGVAGLLFMPNAKDGNAELAEGSLVPAIYVSEDASSGKPIFQPKTAQDEFFDNMMSESLAEIGLTIDDFMSGDLDAMVKKASVFAAEIDLEKLEGSFEEMMIAIAKAWHALDEATAERLLAQSKAAPGESILELLHQNGSINDKQLSSLKEGKDLIDRGIIDFRKMAVAYRDEMDGHYTFTQALDLRKWRAGKQ